MGKLRQLQNVSRHIETLFRFYEREMNALAEQTLKAGKARRGK